MSTNAPANILINLSTVTLTSVKYRWAVARGQGCAGSPGGVCDPSNRWRYHDAAFAQDRLQRAQPREAALEQVRADERGEPEEVLVGEHGACLDPERERNQDECPGEDADQSFYGHVTPLSEISELPQTCVADIQASQSYMPGLNDTLGLMVHVTVCISSLSRSAEVCHPPGDRVDR